MSILYEKYRPDNLNELFTHKEQAMDLYNQIRNVGSPHLLISTSRRSLDDYFVYATAKTLFGENFSSNTEFTSVEEFFSKTKTELKDDIKYSRYYKEAKRSLRRMYKKHDIDKSPSVSKELIFRQYLGSISGNKPVGKINYRLVVLFDSSTLSGTVQNSLRRTMEKFSDNVRYVFVVDSPAKLIPAIRSRCYNINLKDPSEKEVKSKLKQIINKENIKITEQALEGLLYKLDYDYRSSLYFIDAIKSKSKKIGLSDIKSFSTETVEGKVEKSLKKALSGNVKKSIELMDDLLYEENIRLDLLIEKYRKTTYNLSNSSEIRDILINLSKLDREVRNLPSDPNQLKKYSRPLLENFLASIANGG
ncbi:MAG: ATPase involved in DNA replication HolB small subunit [Candidatus Methanohalarchaeum thermophilum]|uniref:ATPase involved in DNA replication HolB small subunit n=1 Tax=Methanohalarchaeum thermophilum TaxID=1903181 RepID=A0A1Q6DUC5_METT1|nr:MAG: ATPase involved in DNA replication HolB small subunit [Candidatus Methanohalarchaeum thermophilum]